MLNFSVLHPDKVIFFEFLYKLRDKISKQKTFSLCFTDFMLATNGIHRIDIKSLGSDEIQPAITLKAAVLVLKPNETKISPLSHRDIVPPHRQIYQNVFTYNFQITKNFEIAIHAPLLSHVLYESLFESQLWMLFDSNKMMIGCGDAYSNRNNIKITKGDYVVKLQVRHEKRELLEKINDLLLHITYKLTNTLSPDVYSSYNDAIVGDKKMQSLHMNGNGSVPLFVAPIAVDKYVNYAYYPLFYKFYLFLYFKQIDKK